jgi:DNA-binding CsgD family transcriptional regulator
MQVPPWMRADDGGGADATRKALAGRRFDRARAEGAKLTVEEVLDTARQTADTGEGQELGALTARETEVLRLLARDMTDAKIAQELVLSRRTVHAHLRSIYTKLDVGSRLAAALWAYDHDLGPGWRRCCPPAPPRTRRSASVRCRARRRETAPPSAVTPTRVCY